MFQKISIHKASLICGKPIKCRVSIFSREQKTIRPIISRVSCFFTCESYHGDSHSCPTDSVSFFKSFARIYKFAFGFQRRISLKKWGRRDLSCMATSVQEYVESMENREEKRSEMCNDVWSERHLKNNDYLVSIINDKRFTSFFFPSLYKFYFTFCAYNWMMRQRENRLSSTIMRRLTRAL